MSMNKVTGLVNPMARDLFRAKLLFGTMMTCSDRHLEPLWVKFRFKKIQEYVFEDFGCKILAIYFRD